MRSSLTRSVAASLCEAQAESKNRGDESHRDAATAFNDFARNDTNPHGIRIVMTPD